MKVCPLQRSFSFTASIAFFFCFQLLMWQSHPVSLLDILAALQCHFPLVRKLPRKNNSFNSCCTDQNAYFAFPLAICINFPSVLNDFSLQSGSKTSVHFIEVTKSHPAIQQYSQWNLEKSNNYSFDLIPALFYLFICLLIYLKPGVLGFFFFFLNVKTIPG